MLMDSLWEQVEPRLQAWVGRDPYWHSSRNIANQEYFVIFQQVTSVLAERIEDRLKHTNLFAFNKKNCWNIFANVLENPNLFLAGIINNSEPLQPLYNNLSLLSILGYKSSKPLSTNQSESPICLNKRLIYFTYSISFSW